jgi:hypothetical protein
MQSIFDVHIAQAKNQWKQLQPYVVALSEARPQPAQAGPKPVVPVRPESSRHSAVLFRLPPWIVPDDQELKKWLSNHGQED